MTSPLVLPAANGAPEDSIESIVCPIRSNTALASTPTGPTKVSMDVPCRKSCAWYLERDGKPACAVTVIALGMADRA